MANTKVASTEIDVISINTGTVQLRVLGTTPLICNRLSEKARFQLLLPPTRKNATEKATTLKHNPLEEYRASVLRTKGEADTAIALPSTAFKGSLCSAALDMPGTKKAQIGRLTFVQGEQVHVYGAPRIFSTIVRSADMNRTPDVRTRAILPEWAATVNITFMRPLLNEMAIYKLLAAAGITIGVGDFRQQKGAGNYGSFEVISEDDQEKMALWNHIVSTGGKDVQLAALDEPEPYDDETAELLSWFDVESKRRGFKVA